MWFLNNKKVLLIMPKYFGYEKYIKEQLSMNGAKVYAIIENLDNVSYKFRFVKNYIPERFAKMADDYFINEINKHKNDIDLVFVIRGEFLSKKVMDYMKDLYGTQCRFVMYQWDSVKNNKNALDISEYFDSIHTFDLEDAKELNWKYRPLFFIDKLVSKQSNRKVDVLFMGSLHSNRIDVLNYLKTYCKRNQLSFSSHLYSKKLIYYKRKYINRRSEYLKAMNSDIKFKSLSLAESYEKYNKSKVVVDFTHPGQTGYTMRTIECLGCECKLVTNNRMVLNSDFYNEKNIYVYNGIDVEIPNEFLIEPYQILDERIKNQYSFTTWLKDIIGSVIDY